MLAKIWKVLKYVLTFFIARAVSKELMIVFIAFTDTELTMTLSRFLVYASNLVGILAAYGMAKRTAKTGKEPHNTTESDEKQDTDSKVNDLIKKENSAFTIIKEEISCWNWQLIIGGLIFGLGMWNILSHFFFAIVLLVFGLGLLSIGATKYKEKQELQERELKRKIMAAVAKESPSEEKTGPAPIPKSADEKRTNRANTKCKTYKVAGVAHYVENIKSLGVENEDYSKSKQDLIAEDMIDERIWKYEFYTRRALLQPEPDNPVDPNAIKVLVDCEHVGYIKSGSCSHVHKLIKNHAIADVICTIDGGPYKCVSEEYDDEKDEDVYILEKGEINFFVHLEIYEKVDVPTK